MRISVSGCLLFSCWLASSLSDVAASTAPDGHDVEPRHLKKKDSPTEYFTKDHDDIDTRGAFTPRIINGEAAERGRFNYFVRLFGTNQCGASLIAPDVAITNAHCGDGRVEEAAVAMYERSDRGEEGVAFRKIAQEVMHPDYSMSPSTGKMQYDLMLVKFDRPVTKPRIQLNFDPNVPSRTGEELYMLGFGFITNVGPNSDTLLGAPTEYLDERDCLDLLCTGTCPIRLFPDDFLCTKLNDPVPTRHCFGDSGGPIIKLGSSAAQDVLVGVIQSSESDCGAAETRQPDENQRISHSLDWILETGCALSDDPPASWNCGGTPADPTADPTPDPSPPPTPPPTRAPTQTPTSNSAIDPTREPTRTPTAAPVSDPTPPPTPGPTPRPTPSPSSETKVNIFVEITFDSSPEETGWFVADDKYDHFRVGIPKGAYQPMFGYAPFSGVSEEISLVAGKRYMFSIEDDNGMCCGDDNDCCSDSGSYKVVTDDGETLVEGDGEFTSSKTEMFTVPFPSR